MYYFDVSRPIGVDDIGRLCAEEFSMIETTSSDKRNRSWADENSSSKICHVNYFATPKPILQVQLWPPNTHRDKQIRSFLLRAKQLLGSEEIYKDFMHSLPPYQID